MGSSYRFPIGTPGQVWGKEERKVWYEQTTIKREYQREVVPKIMALKEHYDVEQYGALSYDVERFPLYAIRSRNWNTDKPVVLVTGGVHGYETSGVHGALKFLEVEAKNFVSHFNILVAPCISPWGYETINRWNPNAIDPNRSFYKDSPAEESTNLMKLLAGLEQEVLVHIDLHETTDTDETQFRPALAARDGKGYVEEGIPDGFYTVADTENPVPEFQKAVIDSVRQVTHIAPADDQGKIIGSPVIQEGVIHYPMKKLGLCGGITDCRFGTTTEVYPDSPKVTDEECNDAQVAAIVGSLNYVMGQL
ncbi:MULTISPECIES: M14 family metallopeptidase [unclassified Endozoicomonas]|uniref:M14 family metallopeptidase n=1 Tax=unclassified Endozoicomonas TaxID=2644528 RepID=UPI003BB6DD43